MRRLAKISLGIIISFWIFSMMASLNPALAAGNAIMILTSVRTDYYVGETIYIDIEVQTNGESINTVRALMDFTGGDVLLIDDFDLGTAWPNLSPGQSLDNILDTINVGGFIFVDSVTQDSLFGTLVFTANQVGSSTINFASGSHLISPDIVERLNLAGSQGITINVAEPVIPNVPPTVLSSNIEVTINQEGTTTVTAFDSDGDNVTITWDAINNSYFSNPVSGQAASVDFTWTPTEIGDFSFPFYATDDGPDSLITQGFVNVSVVDEVIVIEENFAPIFQPESNKSVEIGQEISFQVLVTDPDGDNVNLTWDVPAEAIISNINNNTTTVTVNFRWIPNEQGSFPVNFYATDDNPDNPKNSILTIIINVSIPDPLENQSPVFIPVANQLIDLGETITFNVQATDPDGDNVDLSWNLPSGSSFTNVTSGISANGTFSWLPSQEGVYTLIFSATDDNIDNPLTTDLVVSLGVSVPPLEPNDPPEFANITEKTINANEVITFEVSATDPDGDNVSLTMESFPGANFSVLTEGNTSVSNFSWKPQNFGIYYVVFNATDDRADNNLTKSRSVRITVFGGECPPCGGGACVELVLTCDEVAEIPITEVIPDKTLPIITSPSHPHEAFWYANAKPQFVWDIDDVGILGYNFNLDEIPYHEPTKVYSYSQSKFFAFSEVNDGFWYFHLKTRYEDGWGPTAHYQVKIDTTPPDFFRPSLEENELYFSAVDKHSGVAYYDIKIDQGYWQRATSPLNLNEFHGQGDRLILRAVDNVGNAIESNVDLIKNEVLEEEVQKIYILEDFSRIIEPPFIEKISYKQIRDKLFKHDYLIVSGISEPNAQVTIYLSTEPESIFSTKADKSGIWEAKYEIELKNQEYSIYSIATINNINSLPSEKIYFTFQKIKGISWYYYWFIILIWLIILLLLWKLKVYIHEYLKKKFDNN